MQQVAAVNAVPMNGGLPDGMFLAVTPQENPKDFKEYSALAKQASRRSTADFCAASPEYLQALGIPLVSGRFFDQRDAMRRTAGRGHQPVAGPRHLAARIPSAEPSSSATWTGICGC